MQHRSTLKTLDTVSREALSHMTGRSTFGELTPTATLFDMAYRPGEYAGREVVKIKHLPLRQDLADAAGLDEDNPLRHEFLKSARVSPTFLTRPVIQEALERIAARQMHKADAVNELRGQTAAVEAFLEAGLLPPLRIIPPPPGESRQAKWHTLPELLNDQHCLVKYDLQTIEDVVRAADELRQAWLSEAGDVAAKAERLADALVAVNPEAYPSATRRSAEVVYNRWAGLTIPGSFLYFVAMVLFLVGAYAGTGDKLRVWGVRAMLVALVVHTLGIGVRWWLTEKSTGDWFHSIPIKNQFESVMFSAWFGAVVGLLLELRRKATGGGLFGAAAAFVGFLSLLALFASPHVFGTDIGGGLRQASGILMSYWLYVHVTVVVASYALIGMNFLLGVWWLTAYARGTVDCPAPVTAGTGGFRRTLARALFLPVAATPTGGAFSPAPTPTGRPQSMGQRLDAANLVVLQLAFWMLGIGIVFGAIWADMSWGRPWGWDPKETFALVTWIVYLVILHVRLVTPRKALWTSILSIIGFFIMLFNWIGVNFFLVGLHSYA